MKSEISALGGASSLDAAGGPRTVLLLCNFTKDTAGTILDHIDAFTRFSRSEYRILCNLGDLPGWLDLARFDALIIHYSLVACYDNYLSPRARQQIRDFAGFKAAFVQDDYRWINDTVDALAFMKINALFPLAGPEIKDLVYSPARLPNVRKETVLTGYVPEDLTRRAVPAFAARSIDVGYRARKLPAWLGSHGIQKWQIADRFQRDAGKYRLRVDLSCREEDRIYGEAWIRFVTRCKAVLGTESGASVCDFTGQIQRQVESHLARDPGADFETLRRLYFAQEDGRIMMNVISPRCFEAAALRTLMILYEGHYSGVLKPGRHYVPLARDHSNMQEVVEILRDPSRAQRIVDTAFQEVALNPAYTFKAMVRLVDDTMAAEFKPSMRSTRLPYTVEEFDWRTRRSPTDVTSLVTVSAPSGCCAQQDLNRLLAGGPKAAVVSEAIHPVPHVLELSSPWRLKVRKIHFQWALADAVASKGEILLFDGAKQVGSVQFGEKRPTFYSAVSMQDSVPRSNLIRIVFHEYLHGSQLQLMDLRINSSIFPLEEKIRRARQSAGLALLPYAIIVWTVLPTAARSKMKRYAREAYELLFGRAT